MLISGLSKYFSDLSMILCDPFAVNTMLWSVMKIIHDSSVKEILPRVCYIFAFITAQLQYDLTW